MLGQPINQPQLCKRNDTSLDLLGHTTRFILTVTCTHCTYLTLYSTRSQSYNSNSRSCAPTKHSIHTIWNRCNNFWR